MPRNSGRAGAVPPKAPLCEVLLASFKTLLLDCPMYWVASALLECVIYCGGRRQHLGTTWDNAQGQWCDELSRVTVQRVELLQCADDGGCPPVFRGAVILHGVQIRKGSRIFSSLQDRVSLCNNSTCLELTM